MHVGVGVGVCVCACTHALILSSLLELEMLAENSFFKRVVVFYWAADSHGSGFELRAKKVVIESTMCTSQIVTPGRWEPPLAGTSGSLYRQCEQPSVTRETPSF